MPDELTPGPVSGSGTPAPANPPADGNEERRYAGLQAYYDRELSTRGWRKLTDIPHAQAVTELQQTAALVPDLQKQLTTLQSQVNQIPDLQTQLKTAQAAAQKLQLIAEVDAALLPLASTIATHVDPEAQKTAINDYKAALQKAGFAPAGSSPASTPAPNMPQSSPALPATSSLDAKWKDALKAYSEGRQEDYERLYGEYVQLLPK